MIESALNQAFDAFRIEAESLAETAKVLDREEMRRAVVALANAETICYASPNTLVTTCDDYSLKGNKYLYPDEEVVKKAQYFHNIDAETRLYFENLWEEVTLG